MEEVGRTLASGPIAEAMVAARILAACGDAGADLLGRLLTGDAVVTLAQHDAATAPSQWIAGGAVADAVIVLDGDALYLVEPTDAEKQIVPNLASTPLAQVSLNSATRTLLASGGDAVTAFKAGLEEWKLLVAAMLGGLARESLRLAAAYASEREQFGQLIGTFQGISHPLADLMAETDGGKFLVWRAIRDIADGAPRAAAEISLSLWWNARAAAARFGAGAAHLWRLRPDNRI